MRDDVRTSAGRAVKRLAAGLGSVTASLRHGSVSVRDAMGGPGFDLSRKSDGGLRLRPRTAGDREGGMVVASHGDSESAGSLWVGPGWFDLQVNGFAGVDPNAAGLTREALRSMTTRLHQEGVSRYLVTLISAPPEEMLAAAAAVARACAGDAQLAHAIAGIHLEGPFISPHDGARGAHRVEAVCDADIALIEAIDAAAPKMIRLVTLAPEVPGALALIGALVARGIVVAIGHTLADAPTLRRAVEAGARLSTHLGNGVPTTLPRHPNVIWEQLAEDRLHASVIFDGHHLPRSVMRVIATVKGPERLILISDAVALARMPAGEYRAAIGGRVVLSAEGRLTLAGTPYLAGSASSLLDGVNTALLQVGLSPAAALRAASATPRALLAIEDDDRTLVELGPRGARVVGLRVNGVWVVDELRS